MDAQPVTPDLVLFDPDQYWREPEPEPVLDLAPEPSRYEGSLAQLGWDNQQRGAIAQAEFDSRMVRLGACPNRPMSDPGGGIRSDTVIVIGGRAITVQIKSAKMRQNGRAEFKLGPREGARSPTRDKRKELPYVGRADFFALAVFNEDSVITDWYLIPAKYLRMRVTLVVTPGRRSCRIRKGWFEPELYRNGWERLLDVPTLPRESRSLVVSPTGET